MKEKETDTSAREIAISRLLNAPRELVYEAFTNPEHVIKWWGPNGFTNTNIEMEVKVGGVWRFIMHGPDGTDWPNRIEFTKVVKPERLEYLHSDDVADGKKMQAVVTFEEKGNKTQLTMRMIFDTKEERDQVVKEVGAIDGGNQTIDRLEAYLLTM